MAGIGFQLRRLSQTPTFTAQTAAYVSAAIISAGPWIISISSLMLLNWLLHTELPGDETSSHIRLFTASVTHVYAFALVLTGPLQILLSRYTADQYSLKTPEKVFPSFRGGIILTTLLSAMLGGVFFIGFVPGPNWVFQVGSAVLLVYVSCIFVTSVYLSVLREYQRIVFAFVIGYGVSVASAWYLAQRYQITGAMIGLVIGHLVLFSLLAWSVRREIGKGVGPMFAFLKAARKFPDLLLCGLFYNLGIWIDKFLFWWLSHSNLQVSGALYAAPDYDLAIYLSLLSIVPGMAVFILEVETSFAERFHAYFDAVNLGRSLGEITAAKQQIILSLQAGFNRLLKVQGVTTALLVVAAADLSSLFHVSHVQIGIFRITLFGAFLLMAFLAMLTVLFYFNDRFGALLSSFVFMLANGGLSLLTVLKNEAWYGFGFVLASGLGLFIAAMRVNSRLRDLEYHTFTSHD
ncbi:MAG: histidine kinase [Verrucomicrobiaceae bacterium]|nr:histidine kinase [Verrucomicrobiaceae bacterium]